MPRSPPANACSSRAHVQARTCFEPAAADGDGVMQAGSAAQECPGLFITVAWRSSAWCARVPMQTWARPCFPHPPSSQASSVDAQVSVLMLDHMPLKLCAGHGPALPASNRAKRSCKMLWVLATKPKIAALPCSKSCPARRVNPLPSL